MKKQEYEQAAKIFIELIEQYPNEPTYYINFGNMLTEVKEYEKAENFLRKAIAVDKKAATAYFSLGNLFYVQQRYEKAAEQYEEALAYELEHSDVYFMLGMSLFSEEHYLQALPYLQRATELSNDAEISFQYGLTLAKLNFIDEAEKVFLQVVDKTPNHVDATYNLGVIAVHRNKKELALQLFEEVIAVQQDHTLALKAKENVKQMIAEE